ncbi:MAG: hypothetical protein ABI672_16085 [Vicinamibacteria bacterium]
MWFSEKALVFVDTRSAALAVYRQTLSGPRLERFASERFESHAGQSALFSDVLADSRESVARLIRDLKAPPSDATVVLPLGAAFPSIIDRPSIDKAKTSEVDEADVVRFRLSPLLPFPIAQAEVRTETSASIGRDVVLAQAVLKSLIADSERVMGSLGLSRPRVTTALSAALRGLPARAGTVDLVFGDSACAIAVRDLRGSVEAIHLRLLLPGDDRARRSVDEAQRATAEPREIRALGESVETLRLRASPDAVIHPAFDLPELKGSADPQQFPFLSVFHERQGR